MKKFRVPVTHHETGEFNRFLYETLENGIFMFNECMRDFPRELVIGKEEQFTELHDKNGNEIYEEDIVKDCDKGILYLVVFAEYYAQFMFYDFINDDYYDNRDIAEYEVIGNKQENPELLND